MKKFILQLLICLLLASPCHAGPEIFMGAGGAAAGGNETIGYTSTCTPSQDADNGFARCFGPFTPTNTGTMNSISIYGTNSTATTDFEVGVYVDNSGQPGAIVGAKTSFVDAGTWTAAWHEFSPVSYNVTGGTAYWLCIQPSATFYVCQTDVGTGQHFYYKTHTFGDAWPDPYAGSNIGAYYHSIKANVSY